MDDLTMTRLCAEAMGLDMQVLGGTVILVVPPHPIQPMVLNYKFPLYDPLHDDAQAMQLMKRLNIMRNNLATVYTLDYCDEDGTPYYFSVDDADDLNRAIVSCVAQMQDAKTATA